MNVSANAKQSFGFHEICWGSWLAEELLASQKFLCSMELVIYLVR